MTWGKASEKDPVSLAFILDYLKGFGTDYDHLVQRTYFPDEKAS